MWKTFGYSGWQIQWKPIDRLVTYILAGPKITSFDWNYSTRMAKLLTLLIAAFMKKTVVMWLFVCKKSCDNILDAHCFPCAEGSNGFLL